MPSPSFSPERLSAPGISALTPYQPGKPISELQRELGLKQIVKLASNENPLGPGEKALHAAQRALAEAHLYPDGSGHDLKNALARKLGVACDQITLGNGSNDVLEVIARTFLSVGDHAVFSEHAFAVYAIVTQAVGATSRVAPAHDGRRGPRYGHDLERLAAAIDSRTKLVFIANPNNPTGTYLPLAQLDGFLAAVPSHLLVVIDEAYVEYVDAPDYGSLLSRVTKYPNLIVTRTFSKAYGLAGLRIGYAVSTAGVAELLNRVRQPFNVNSVAMAAAEAALGDEDYLLRSIALNRAGYTLLKDAFDERRIPYIPSVGNFITIDLQRTAGPIYQALLRKGVIVRPIGNYGLPNHLRVTVGTETENRFFIDALDQILGT
jgi:histidinol-phosphate aminotransferase